MNEHLQYDDCGCTYNVQEDRFEVRCIDHRDPTPPLVEDTDGPES